MYVFSNFVKNQMAVLCVLFVYLYLYKSLKIINVFKDFKIKNFFKLINVYIWIFYSISLMYVSVFVPVPFYFCYNGSVV
jgi:hypothetical protein